MPFDPPLSCTENRSKKMVNVWFKIDAILITLIWKKYLLPWAEVFFLVVTLFPFFLFLLNLFS